MTETATATIPIEAPASTEAAATLLATASTESANNQQTQPVQTQEPVATEKPAESIAETKAAETTGAPEAYTFAAPEGTAFDPAIVDAFSGAAKEANLTQDAAQKLVEKMAPAIAARQLEQVQAIQKEWRDATTADPEVGGEQLLENLAVAKKGLNFVNDPELTKLLDETGLGNHPAVIRGFFRIGKAISEDKFVGGSPSGSGATDKASVLYDKTPK